MADPISAVQAECDAAIRAHAPAGRLVVALSGGRDSSVLLHLLARAFADRRLVAVHVDHGLHPRSQEWAEHCRALAESLGVAFRQRRIRVSTASGESLEALAREARYRVLAEVLGEGDSLLTAHHAGDQLETLMQRLLRGAGREGLSGIRHRRPLGRGQLLRPLLTVESTAIQACAEAIGLSWVEDPSNRDERFDRNFIRHRLLPLLQTRWPAAERLAARTAANLAQESALLREIAEADLARLRQGDRLLLSALAALSPRRQRNALRYWLEEGLNYAPGPGLLDRLLEEVIGARPDASPRLVIEDHAIRRHGDHLYLTRARDTSPDPGPYHWQAPADELELPGNGRLRLEAEQGGEQVRLPALVTVRYRHPGDVFHDGRHHRRLKEWLRLAGIPEEARDRVPLLLDGDRIFAVGETLLDPRYTARDTGAGPARTGRLRWYRSE